MRVWSPLPLDGKGYGRTMSEDGSNFNFPPDASEEVTIFVARYL